MARSDRYWDYNARTWRIQVGDTVNPAVDEAIGGTLEGGAPESPEITARQDALRTSTYGQQQYVSPGQISILQIDSENARHIRTENRLDRALDAQIQQARESNAFAAQQLADNAAARSADAAYRSQALAQDAAQFQARMAFDERLAEKQAALQKLGYAINASLASGYIPASLAAQLGITAGPTLEAQSVAWQRFMQAYEMVSNPRNLPGYLNLIEGIEPGSAAAQAQGVVPAFLSALASGQMPGQPLVSGREQAISENARAFTAGLMEKIPAMFTNEQLNPEFTPTVQATTPVQDFMGGLQAPLFQGARNARIQPAVAF